MFGKDFEEDYIMRQIKNIIEFTVKLVCHVDTTAQFRQEMKEDAFANRLLEQARNGEFNEAENALYAKADERDTMTLRAGLIFYDYLNSLDDTTLETHDFSRDEVQDGLRSLLRTFGMGEMADLITEKPAEEPAEAFGYPPAEELNPAYYNYTVCPYCGKTMDPGYILGEAFYGFRLVTDGSLYWSEHGHPLTELSVDSHRNHAPMIRGYKCASCKRIILHSYVEET